jgi:hypothetical protein
MKNLEKFSNKLYAKKITKSSLMSLSGGGTTYTLTDCAWTGDKGSHDCGDKTESDQNANASLSFA